MNTPVDDSQSRRAESRRAPGSDELADQQRISDLVTSIMQRRAIIEQAKGMLMASHAIGEEEAFELLRQQSQRHNVKLSALAEQVVRDVVELVASRDHRADVEGVLRTAHQRVKLGSEVE